MKRNELLKIRYQILRDLGYSSKEASKLRNQTKSYEIEIKNVKIDKKTKQVIKSKNYKTTLKNQKINEFVFKAQDVKNDTTYTKWGMLTQDKRYKDDTARVVKRLERQHKISNNQAYYMLYFMTRNNISYKQARLQLLSNKEFEMYDKRKTSK